MSTITALPAAASLTGAEDVPADQGGLTVKATIAQILAKGAALYSLPPSWDFPTAMLGGGFTLTNDFKFGSAATGGNPNINTLADLATYFNPQPDAVGSAVQNEEVERFTAFGSGNHILNANDLSLTATLEAGGTFDVVAKNTVGAVTGSAVLTFTDTTGINDGMMYASSAGTATTGIRVLSHDSTTVTLSSTVTLPNNSSVEFMPVYVCSGIQAGTSISTINYSIVPAAIVAGMFYNNITAGTFGIRRVLSTTPTSVTLDGTVTVQAGNFTFYSPPVTSGQIWSKAGFQPGKNGLNAVAFELTCTIPQSAASQAGAARGAWPAFWLYSKTSDGFSFDASEIDIFEFFESLTAGSNAYTSNIHGGSYNATKYQRSVGSGSSKWDASGFYRPGIDYGAASHRFQLIWTPDRVYRGIDDQQLISTDFNWSSQDTAQWAIDLACGSFLSAFLAIYFYPRATGQFPFAIKITEVKIYTA